ncbi:MAG: endonuclease III [Nitrososphaerota archaeon]|nr:endonuclease III [Nitrososphaerota archaeon]
MARTTLSGDDVVQRLDDLYPKIKTPLAHRDAFQLLIATILSAQCTDAQVNLVTPKLFKRYPDAKSLARAKISDLEQIIKPTGFFHVKSLRIKAVAEKIVSNFGGKVPSSMEELVTLPGVGRKTANIVLSAGFDKIEGVAVDTHVQRLAQRIGLSKQKTPEKIEIDLMKVTSKQNWPRLTLLLILHGRSICNAKKPLCEKCVLSKDCLYYNTRAK